MISKVWVCLQLFITVGRGNDTWELQKTYFTNKIRILCMFWPHHIWRDMFFGLQHKEDDHSISVLVLWIRNPLVTSDDICTHMVLILNQLHVFPDPVSIQQY